MWVGVRVWMTWYVQVRVGGECIGAEGQWRERIGSVVADVGGGVGQANKKAREDLAATLARHAQERLDLEDEREVIKEILRYLGLVFVSSLPPASRLRA